MFGIWLWRPNKQVDRQPIPEDYRVCLCRGFTAKRTFEWLTYASIGFYVLFVAYLVLTLFVPLKIRGIHLGWDDVAVGAVDVALSLLAIKTLKPIWVQLLFPVTILWYVVITIKYAIGAMDAYSHYTMTVDRNVDSFFPYNPENKGLSIQEQQKIETLTEFVGGIVSVVMMFPCGLWTVALLYSYYSYLRDRQLYEEQNEKPIEKPLNVLSPPEYKEYEKFSV